MKICKEEYIGLVDNDDYIDLDMHEILLKYSCKVNLDTTMCGFNRVDNCMVVPAGNPIEYFTDNKNIIIKKALTYKHLSAAVAVWNKLFKRSVLENIRFDVGEKFDNAYFVMKWIEHTKRFGMCGVRKYYYVNNNSSVTHYTTFNKSICNLVEAQLENLNLVSLKYNECLPCAVYNLYKGYRGAIDVMLSCVDINRHKNYSITVHEEFRDNISSFIFNQYMTI